MLGCPASLLSSSHCYMVCTKERWGRGWFLVLLAHVWGLVSCTACINRPLCSGTMGEYLPMVGTKLHYRQFGLELLNLSSKEIS